MSQQAIDQAERALNAAYHRVVDRHSVAGALDLARARQRVGLAYLEDGQFLKGYSIMSDAAGYYSEAGDHELAAQCFDQVADAYEMAGNSEAVQSVRGVAARRRSIGRNSK